MRKSVIFTLSAAVVFGACAGGDDVSARDECVPTTPSSVEISGDPNRKIEDIIEYLYGEHESVEEEGVRVEDKIDDPNFGGVWGDFGAGVVVAVLDCSLVDADRLAEMAGGSDYLHLIEVPYTFHQIDEFRDALVQDLRDSGVEGGVAIESTLTGRWIEVLVRDITSLPESFGSDVPDDAYEILEGGLFGTPAG
jgi:hypothetical protein